MFLSIGAMARDFLHVSPIQCMGQHLASMTAVRNGRCVCPNIAGTQFKLEEQARLLELLLESLQQQKRISIGSCFHQNIHYISVSSPTGRIDSSNTILYGKRETLIPDIVTRSVVKQPDNYVVSW